jgi:uracil-DNA glycosylase
VPDEASVQATRRIVLQCLEGLQRAGVGQLPKPKRQSTVPKPQPSIETATVPNQSAIRKPQIAIETSTVDPADRAAALVVIRDEVAACVRCQELASTRKQTVFGVGDPHARLCFMGEAPGADEDQRGEPFVGKAGQLLDKIIEACTLRREQVYILNTIKCRPPGNRAPELDERTNCRGFLERQLDVIRPEYICCLGATAAQSLLKTDVPIGRLRGKFFEFRGSRVLCTYHPAYLLRNPAAKRDVWDDMQLLMREMGIALPAR